MANPNVPTGFIVYISEIERRTVSDLERLFIIYEAYIDFDNY
ncbi:hypothetical protein [Clostridium sp.]|nr:hypothetical protein [Clostridium sp.]MDU6540180.1 hypothetical protein [Clostridium sp.]